MKIGQFSRNYRKKIGGLHFYETRCRLES